ncbi:thioredoxin family protein [Croceitalea dokdonensis]|nr:thioredoxin family protein [Croceitalea dokdonensis]
MKPKFLMLLFFLPLGLMAQDWEQDYQKVVQRASQENKLILLVFSGSDWCAPCIKLERTIWQSEEFQNHANANYVLYRADFPRKKANRLPNPILNQNKALAERFNTNGLFPLVILMRADETVLGQTGYKKLDPNAYIDHLNSFLIK